MEPLTPSSDDSPTLLLADDALFGWDPTPGIVSVWASRAGKAWVWQRSGDRVNCTGATFRPWLFATTIDDLAHLGSTLQPQQDEAAVSYRILDGLTAPIATCCPLAMGACWSVRCWKGHRGA